MKRFAYLIICSWLLVLAGCQEVSLEARAINPEVDVCVVCNMSIAHEEYATQVIMQNGDHYMFDDIGCMMDFIKSKEPGEIGKSYVRDQETGEWVDLNSAYFVYEKSFWTPMSYGVLSFSSEERATEYIAEQGKGRLLTYADLEEHRWGLAE